MAYVSCVPEPGESHGDFMDRCAGKGGDPAFCQSEWNKAKGYSAKQRMAIHLKAKRKLCIQKQGAADKYLFMQQCIDQLTTEDGEDDGSARNICELLWEEGGDLSDFGD